MARAHDDHIFNSLPTKNILKVVKLTHPWPEHLHLFIQPFNCHPELIRLFLTHSWPEHLSIPLTHHYLRVILFIKCMCSIGKCYKRDLLK